MVCSAISSIDSENIDMDMDMGEEGYMARYMTTVVYRWYSCLAD